MRVIIVNASTSIEPRTDMAAEYFRSRGAEVLYLGSDLVHIGKRRRTSKEGMRLIPTLFYRRNISIRRLLSHWLFSRDALRIMLKEPEADLLWLSVPHNSNAAIGPKYQKRFPKARMVVDITDLWPETMPFSGTGRFPFTLWSGIRDRALAKADLVLLECRLFERVLGRRLDGVPHAVMPWLKQDRPWNSAFEDASYRLPDDEVRLCYLGSVNNIIDTDCLLSVVEAFQKLKPVTVELIASGERKEELLGRLRETGAGVVDHGESYDEAVKQAMMDRCHFGLNIMKRTVVIGMSMKSIDYLAGGIPMITNIGADTAELVNGEHTGICLGEDGSFDAARALSEKFDRAHIRKVFETRYSSSCFADYYEAAKELI